VLGIFTRKGSSASDETLETAVDKIPPATGDAAPPT